MNCVTLPGNNDDVELRHSIQQNDLELQLQRTTHLYCRSLDKERDRRTSKGLASCLRGEPDELIYEFGKAESKRKFSTFFNTRKVTVIIRKTKMLDFSVDIPKFQIIKIA